MDEDVELASFFLLERGGESSDPPPCLTKL